MLNVKLYEKTNNFQKKDASIVLKEYSGKIKWKRYGDRTIDIGCGDGGVLMEVIKKHIPDNYKIILGCDISKDMVQFADSRYCDERTKFIELDIVGDIPIILKNSFDHAFSFFVFNWIKDQTKAFLNIYDLLEIGGDTLVVQIGKTHVYEAYRKLAKVKRWAEYMKNVNLYVSPYHDSSEPEKEIRNIMENTGFKNVNVECMQKQFEFATLEDMKRTLQSINPFKIPNEKYEEFMENYLEILCEVTFNMKSDEDLCYKLKDSVKYDIIIAYGTK